MQEFESISASSYDPSALATKLTAKAAEGWAVVAIVPTGGDVTAFVTRDTDGANAASKPSTEASEPKDEAAAAPADKADDKADDQADDKADDAPAPALPAKTEAMIEPKSEPVSEPSGWAIAPEPATPTVEPTGVQPTVTITPMSTYEPAVTAAPAAAAATPAAAAAPAVPAGWYADPAGRFELRYWDGSTWTEHVSRAGQQFTDPPVA